MTTTNITYSNFIAVSALLPQTILLKILSQCPAI